MEKWSEQEKRIQVLEAGLADIARPNGLYQLNETAAESFIHKKLWKI